MCYCSSIKQHNQINVINAFIVSQCIRAFSCCKSLTNPFSTQSFDIRLHVKTSIYIRHHKLISIVNVFLLFTWWQSIFHCQGVYTFHDIEYWTYVSLHSPIAKGSVRLGPCTEQHRQGVLLSGFPISIFQYVKAQARRTYEKEEGVKSES